MAEIVRECERERGRENRADRDIERERAKARIKKGEDKSVWRKKMCNIVTNILTSNYHRLFILCFLLLGDVGRLYQLSSSSMTIDRDPIIGTDHFRV